MRRSHVVLLAAALALPLAACGSSAQGEPPVHAASVEPAVPKPAADVSAASSDGASSPVAPVVAAVAAPGRETALIARSLLRVSRARGITTTQTIPGVVLSRAAIIARIKEHVAREIPPEAIRNEGLANQLLGLVPTSFDYEAAEFGLLEAQIAGYYEPSDKTMYLVADEDEKESEATLAHELVHALQDSRWDLASRSKYRPGESDHALATGALAEGDATSAMFDVMFAMAGSDHVAIDVPDEAFIDQLRESMEHGPGADAPEVMRSSLVAPYLYGVVFINALRRRGGWDAVNQAWDTPPMTTEQLLHLDKYDAHEPAETVAPPTFASLGTGWAAVDADTYGELGARIDFESWMGPRRAARAASGWAGDRAVLVQRGASTALAWHLRYDVGARAPDELARTAFALLGPSFESRADGAPVFKGPDSVCVDRADRGPLLIARSGRDLAIIAGPATTTGPAWTSNGHCDLALRWARETLAPHTASTP